MKRHAPADVPTHPLMRERWSPYVFDPHRGVSESDLHGLFEAARWAMSSWNAQPWRYIVGIRGRRQQTWDEILGVLVEPNQRWAQNAPVLALSLFERNLERDGKINRSAVHDLGAASAFLTCEATARGIYVHQMAGIDIGKARETFDIPGSLEPFAGMAIGYPGDPAQAEQKYAERDRRERVRKPLQEIIIRGGW